jgi:hypothetical protein
MRRIIILIIGLVILLGGYFVWREYNIYLKTAGFNVYENNNYGFRISYPQDWLLDAQYKDTWRDLEINPFYLSVVFEDAEKDYSVYLEVYSDAIPHSLSEWIEIMENNPTEPSFSKAEDVYLADLSGKRGIFGCCTTYLDTIFLTDGKHLFELQGGNLFNNHYNYEDIFEQMISSFDFTGSLSKEISKIVDWQTYRSQEHGFEIKYPNDWEVDFSLFSASDPQWFFCPSDLAIYSDNKIVCRIVKTGKELVYLMAFDAPMNISSYRYLGYDEITSKYFYLYSEINKTITDQMVPTFRFLK